MGRQSPATHTRVFANRNRLPDESGIYRYRLATLPGRVLYKDPGDANYELKSVVLKSGYRPSLEPIKEGDGRIYEGMINQKIAASATYIAISAALDAKSLASVHIQDRVISFIENEDVPWDLLGVEGRKPKPAPGGKRYWVQGALMASLDYRTATEVDVSAGGKLTEAFGANGKVYSKSDSSTHDYRISVYLIDLDNLPQVEPELKTVIKAPKPDSAAFARILKPVRPENLSVRIKGDMD